jgi:hypothetical protein
VPFQYSPPIPDNLTAPIIVLQQGCFVSNVSNSIVLSTWEDGCSFATKIRSAQQGGALALLVETKPLPGSFARAYEIPKHEVTIPILSVHRTCIRSLMSSGSPNITGTILFSSNYWLTIYDHSMFYFGQVIIGLISSLLVIISVVGVVYNYMSIRKFTTKTVVLQIEGLIHLCLLCTIIDIANSRGIYSTSSVSFLIRFTNSLVPMTNLLMGFFFLEIFHNQINNAQESFLNTYKCHFITATFICILGSFIMGILGSQYLIPPDLLTIIAGLLVTIMNLFALSLLIAVLVKCWYSTKLEGYLQKIRTAIFRFVIICIILTFLMIAPVFFFMELSYIIILIISEF